MVNCQRLLAAAMLFGWVLTSPTISETRLPEDRAETLADVRLQLLSLYEQMEQLRRQLSPGPSAPQEIHISDLNALRQLDNLETELRDAIGRIEELEFQILRIAADGKNQINDLEFQLVQLGGGDLGQLSEGAPLGTTLREVRPEPPEPKSSTIVADLSNLEEDMFNEAYESYQSGQLETAKQRFLALIDAYPEGEFVAESQYFVGETFVVEGSWSDAGKAFLASFNKEQDGPIAPKALLRLGESLSRLDKLQDACEILKNVGAFFPNSGEAGLADAQVARLDCG